MNKHKAAISARNPRPEAPARKPPAICAPAPDQRRHELHWVFRLGDGFRAWQYSGGLWWPGEEGVTVHQVTEEGWRYLRPAESPLPRDQMVIPAAEATRVRRTR